MAEDVCGWEEKGKAKQEREPMRAPPPSILYAYPIIIAAVKEARNKSPTADTEHSTAYRPQGTQYLLTHHRHSRKRIGHATVRVYS